MTSFGKLYLVPCPIGEIPDTIPMATLERIHSLKHYVAERAKTARQFLKTCQLPFPIQEVHVQELDKHGHNDPAKLLQPCLDGHAMGLLSEAGCPGVADPGSTIVARAHELGIEVIPLVGPSSLLLSLMASGLNGQKFIFHGYLSIDKEGLKRELKKYEQHSAKENCTQIAIETPYRNNRFVEMALSILEDSTLLTIACDLNNSQQFIQTKTIGKWKKAKIPDLHKKPTVFCWKLNK